MFMLFFSQKTSTEFQVLPSGTSLYFYFLGVYLFFVYVNFVYDLKNKHFVHLNVVASNWYMTYFITLG